MRVQSVVGLLLIVAFSGCASTDPVTDLLEEEAPEIWASPDWAIDALANTQDHDHYNWTHHEGRTTPNFETIGADALVTQRAGGSSGGYLCGEIGVDIEGRTLAVTQSHYDDVALVVADITNASAPEMIGELVVSGFSTYDAAITDDARFALVAVSSGGLDGYYATPAAEVPVQVGWRNGCSEALGPVVKVLPVPSVLLVDLQDPTSPVIVDQAIVPGAGVHSVSEATIGGTYYVAASTTGATTLTSTFVFFTIEEIESVGPTLSYFGGYDGTDSQSRETARGLTNFHSDATIQKHPGTGQVLAYLANWNGGMMIVELVAPGTVVWQDSFGASGIGGTESFDIHSTHPVEALWDDRHYTIVGEETITPRAGMPTGMVLIIDTTDPTDIKEVARWTLPSDVGGWDTGLVYSPHYAAIVDQTVFVSMYHGGVWAFDASPEHWPHPPTVGVYIPSFTNEHAPAPQGGWEVMSYTPVLSEVLATEAGDLVTFDSRGGVYTYRYTHSDLVEPVPSWFA